jgi:hypothetical protein
MSTPRKKNVKFTHGDLGEFSTEFVYQMPDTLDELIQKFNGERNLVMWCGRKLSGGAIAVGKQTVNLKLADATNQAAVVEALKHGQQSCAGYSPNIASGPSAKASKEAIESAQSLIGTRTAEDLQADPELLAKLLAALQIS